MSKEIYLGRQPIFDAMGKCIGYELLYRARTEAVASFSDDAQATARVIINLIHNIGFASIIGDKIGFINVDDHILLSDALLSLPKDQCVFEILEYTKMSVAVVERVKHLYEMGYRFALDDFCCKSHNIDYFRLLFPYIEMIKIDLLIAHEKKIEEILHEFKPYNVKFLAEKIENMATFEQCKKEGFEYFQGFFFEKPSILSGKKIEPVLNNVIDLINTFYQTSDADVIAEKFALYPDLTYNLLRYINSAAFRFTNKITSIRQIILMLGPSKLRSWLGLFLYAGAEEMFGEALFNAAKFRAKTMHDMAIAHGKTEMADEAFLTGSLSLIDAYLHIGMEEVLEKIDLGHPIAQALLHRDGYLGTLLTIAEKLERTDKIQSFVEHISPKMHLSAQKIYQIYCDANEFVLKSGA